MDEALATIVRIASAATTRPVATDIPGVVMVSGDVPAHQLSALYEPVIGFVVQGSKTFCIGERIVRVPPRSYFVFPFETPASGRVDRTPDGRPYVSVSMRIEPDAMLDLLAVLPETEPADDLAPEFAACPATNEFAQAWLRLLRLLETPRDIPALASVYQREILYRALCGPQGGRIRSLLASDGTGSRIRQAVQWIRAHVNDPIEVADLARRFGMATTTFHRHFKQITDLTPLQFQKQLRLLQARKLLVFGDRNVSQAAFDVGYESPSQFTREYARFFGAPPTRDAAAVRETVRAAG